MRCCRPTASADTTDKLGFTGSTRDGRMARSVTSYEPVSRPHSIPTDGHRLSGIRVRCSRCGPGADPATHEGAARTRARLQATGSSPLPGAHRAGRRRGAPPHARQWQLTVPADRNRRSVPRPGHDVDAEGAWAAVDLQLGPITITPGVRADSYHVDLYGASVLHTSVDHGSRSPRRCPAAPGSRSRRACTRRHRRSPCSPPTSRSALADDRRRGRNAA